MKEFQPNDILDRRYKLLKLLNNGENAMVWTALDNYLEDDLVVLKIFLVRNAYDKKEIIRNFLRIDKVDPHNHIIRPYDLGICEENTVVYAKLKFVRDGNLANLLSNEQKLTELEVAHLIAQIGSALQHIHAAGIVHSDVKPENILVREDNDGIHYFLADFDFSIDAATIQGGRRTKIRNNNIVKRQYSDAYFSPQEEEQGSCDIFALGVSLYELLTGGTLPLGTNAKFSFIANENPVPDLPNVPKEFSRGLNKIVRQCMEKDPEKRPTAAELTELANGYLEKGSWEKEQPIPDSPRAVAPLPKNKWILQGLSFLLGCITCFLGYLLFSPKDIPPSPDKWPPVDSLVDRNRDSVGTLTLPPKINDSINKVEKAAAIEEVLKEKKVNRFLDEGVAKLNAGDYAKARSSFVKIRWLNATGKQFAKARIDSLYLHYSNMGDSRFSASEYVYAKEWYWTAKALVDSPEINQKLVSCDEKLGN